MSAKIPLSIMFVTTVLGCVLMWKLARQAEARESDRSALVFVLGAPTGR